MKRWMLAAVLCVAPFCSASARGDELNERAAQIKADVYPALDLRMRGHDGEYMGPNDRPRDANDTFYASSELRVLSRASRLGYTRSGSTYLELAQVRYKDLLKYQDKTTPGYFWVGESGQGLTTWCQAYAVMGLVEYARASGEIEPRSIALETWRFIRDRARDKSDGSYFSQIRSGKLGPNQAGGFGVKDSVAHLALLEAGTALYDLTHDQSLRRDVKELLDLNESLYHSSLYSPDECEAGVAIAQAQRVLGMPVKWVDLVRRVEFSYRFDSKEIEGLTYLEKGRIAGLTLLARELPGSRRSFGTELLPLLPLHQRASSLPVLEVMDFVAAFDRKSPSPVDR